MNPAGRVILVATPIGNLRDITLRALDVLRDADWIYAEDTRHSGGLLHAHDIAANGRLRSLHSHNEQERADEIVTRAREGATIAYVSDAGTPGISDPGERVVRACVDAGITVEMTPGASAVLPALVLSGLPTTPFMFMGFLERKGATRTQQLSAIAASNATTVIYESPKRLAATLSDLAGACGGTRRAAVVRELTKLFEQVERSSLEELVAAVDSEALPERGECVVVIDANNVAPNVASDAEIVTMIGELHGHEMRSRDIADAVAARFGLPRREAYEHVLAFTKVKARR